MKRGRLLLALCILCLPSCAQAEVTTAGFVQGLWYSSDPLIVDEPTRIYAAVRNNTGADLSGTVRFSINDEVVTTRRVTALDGRIIETWTDWTPAYGEHTVSATLSRVELSTVGGEEEAITVVAALAEDVIFVDYDTDGDGVPNEADSDDDGDGISDETEMANNTDPLDPDSPAPEPEPDTTNESADDQTNQPTAGESNAPAGAAPSRGLEQFLTPSRAENMLRGITEWADSTKEVVDEYRMSRAPTLIIPTSTDAVLVDENGFGAVTRRDANTAAREYEGADSVVQHIVGIIATIVQAIFTGVLAGLSFVLSYPMLIQVALLLLLLLLILRVARFFGRRPE